jgi:hypothetical protein
LWCYGFTFWKVRLLLENVQRIRTLLDPIVLICHSAESILSQRTDGTDLPARKE